MNSEQAGSFLDMFVSGDPAVRQQAAEIARAFPEDAKRSAANYCVGFSNKMSDAKVNDLLRQICAFNIAAALRRHNQETQC